MDLALIGDKQVVSIFRLLDWQMQSFLHNKEVKNDGPKLYQCFPCLGAWLEGQQDFTRLRGLYKFSHVSG